MKYLLLLLGVALQIHIISATESRVVQDTPPKDAKKGKTYATIYYSEDDMPEHTAHLYWHCEKFKHHKLYYPTTSTSRKEEGVHKDQGLQAIGNVVSHTNAGFPNTVKDEKLPAFMRHTSDGKEITIAYLDSAESQRKQGLKQSLWKMLT